MLWYWITKRFFSWNFVRDFLLVVFRPDLLREAITTANRRSYYRAFDFLFTAIKVGIFIALIASAFLNTMLYELAWYMVLILNFILLGLITCLVLIVLGETKVHLDNIYYYLAFPAGASIVLITLFTSSMHIAENSLEISSMLEKWAVFLNITPLLKFIPEGYYVFKYSLLISAFFLIWSFWIFAWMMKCNLNIRLWKIIPSLFIAFAAISWFTMVIIDFEAYVFEMLPKLA